MLEPRDKLIEDFGLYFEQYGLPRILGRMYGLLLITDAHQLGLDEMAQRLGVSKASASTGARQLQGWQLIEKASLPGDRRDYYRVSPEAHTNYLRATLEKTLQFARLLQQAAQLENLSQQARDKLERIEHVYEALSELIDDFFARYQPLNTERQAQR